jgi:hypothetical protein
LRPRCRKSGGSPLGPLHGRGVPPRRARATTEVALAYGRDRGPGGARRRRDRQRGLRLAATQDQRGVKRATEIVSTAVAQAEKYNVPRTATVELLTRAEGLFDDMARLGRSTALVKLHQFMAELALLDLDIGTSASASAASTDEGKLALIDTLTPLLVLPAK